MVGRAYVSAAAVLPCDIVYMIVQQVYHSTGLHLGVRRNMGRKLARMVGVLGVSTAWRRAALPLAYSAVVCEPVDGRWHTNLALFQHGMSQWARRLMVSNDMAAGALEQLGFARMQWPRLTEVRAPPGIAVHLTCALVVRCQGRTPRSKVQRLRAASAECAIRVQPSRMTRSSRTQRLRAAGATRAHEQRPAGAFRAQHVHGAGTFQMHELRTNPETLLFSDLHRPLDLQLAGAFRVQLPNACSGQLFIRDMSVAWTAHSWAAIARAAATLEHLRVIDIPHGRARDVLRLSSIGFPNVQTLVLQFTDAAGGEWAPRDERRRITAGGFPRLKRLRLCDIPFDLRECVAALGGSTAARVEIEVGSELVNAARLLSWDARSLEAASLDVTCVGAAHLPVDRASKLVRQIVRTAPKQLQHLRMAVRTVQPLARTVLDHLSLQCTALETLDLRVPIRLVDCVAVVRSLPHLWNLRLPYVSTEELPESKACSLDRLYTEVGVRSPAPISMSLQRVHVGFWDYRQTTRALCCHVIYFLSSLPNVMAISTEMQFAHALQAAIDGLHVMHRRQARWSSVSSKSDYRWLDHLGTLQFPDELLADSTLVSAALQERTEAHVFILADMSYSSCCVDEVAAEHYAADVLVHYGRTCLSLTTRLPVVYVFGHDAVDVANLCAQCESELQGSQVLLVSDVQYIHVLEDIGKALHGVCKKVVVSCIAVQDCVYVPGAEDAAEPGWQWELEHPIGKHTMLYVGKESLTLTNLLVTKQCQSVFSYMPQTYANVVGIVVETLVAVWYQSVINALKQLIWCTGKKFYVFVVGKLNVAKLANFPEIKAYVLVACPENLLVNLKDFYQPVVTPYELLLALSWSHEWTGNYITDFHAFLNELDQHTDDDVGDEEDVPHFSLVTGTLQQAWQYNNPRASSSRDVTVQGRSTEIAQYMGSAGTEHLLAQAFCRLGHDDQEGKDSKPMLAVDGLSGIASKYTHKTK
ncbi:Diphthamide biosynthesis protein 2 [Coemansia sp. RSA 678]|nr:Diphthamide biosynthesis protein 2 [Coemansia sp. RSA 678]